MDEKRTFRFHLLPIILRFLFPPASKRAFPPPKTVVCLRPGKIGDLLVATPLFSALKQHGGVERVAIICSPGNEVAVRCNPFIDECLVINFHRITSVLSAIGWMRRRKFGALIDLTPGFSRTNFMMSYGAGRRTLRVGIEKEALADRYHVHVEKPGTHLADRFLEAGEKLTGSRFPENRTLEIYSGEKDREAAAAFVDRYRGEHLIAINLSSATMRRQWDRSNFDRLIELLSARLQNIRLILIAVGEQREWARELAQKYPQCAELPEGSFLTAVEVIAGSRMLISPDTSLVHAAAARRVPLVGLYVEGGENFARWHPYHATGAAIQARPGRDANDIDPATVCEAAVEVFNGSGALQVISFSEENPPS